ncbi:P-loop containing nucleoside triphosphate hydrolase protein [Thozetella sp. PMI_491]|nr:P-loop containing nucleoside triphosphate hydrolase protein [Thozetella sp. PMI_491]
MDQFYLENAALYQKLVKALGPSPEHRAAAATTERTSPDLVVSARIRPLLKEDIAAGFPQAIFPRAASASIVDVHDLYNHPRGRPILKSFNYQVDQLFGSEASTEEIYENLVADLAPFAWSGGIGTLFAYGQTGSGKTFTVSRLQQLVAESLMERLEGDRQIFISIIDLAGNSPFDLLNSRKPISILEDSFGVTQWAGAKEHLVQDRRSVANLIERATSFRRTAPTLKNDASSRSHSICRIRIHDPSATCADGLLYLIDLAGSEAARDVAVHGADRMRETREINISLSVLKDCIRGKVEFDALRGASKSKQKKPHIPFRQSTLTKVLKHVFDPAGGRACKTVVIACINPILADVGPSKNTLRYAEMLRVLLPAAAKTQSNPTAPMAWSTAQLKEWIDKNSGSPPISSALLAPTESGAALLQLPPGEFEGRFLKTPGISSEQAKAFRAKLWQMHVDSQRAGKISPASMPNPGEPAGVGANSGLTSRKTSRDLDPSATEIPFQQRIRPGMVVSWNQPRDRCLALGLPEGPKLAAVLSPMSAVPEFVKNTVDSVGGLESKEPTSSVDGGVGADRQYLCALVSPGRIAEAYELHLWQQIVLDVSMMDKEVILEYEASTRYYHISL